MFIFIGGAPRVGKTLLANKVSKKLDIPCVSVDALRDGAFNLGYKQITRSYMFVKKRLGAYDDPIKYYENHEIPEIINNEILESKEIMKLVKGFIEKENRNGKSFILVGTALMPDLVDTELKNNCDIRQHHVVNLDFESYLDYSLSNRGDTGWLAECSERIFSKVVRVSYEISRLYQTQCDSDKDIFCYPISSENFEKDIDKSVKQMKVNIKGSTTLLPISF